MTSRDFCYWLQGLFELADPKTLDEKQTDLIKRHLNLVFVHEIDPSHSDDPKVQGALQAVHDGVDVNELRDKIDKAMDKIEPLGEQVKARQPRFPGGSDIRYMC